MNELFIEAEELRPLLNEDKLIIVDICQAKTFLQIHLPNAIHINYNDFVASKKPVFGLLPTIEQFEQVLDSIGWDKDAKVICYDEEGGGMAGRFIWTCHAFGINNVRILNGGINYWYKQGFDTTTEVKETLKTSVKLKLIGNNVCDAEYIIKNQSKLKLMDARSIEEYQGTKKYAQRAGHIPNAIHFNWENIMNKENSLKTHAFDYLDKKIQKQGFDKDDEIIVYCQTHHRSALNYTLLKHLGYNNVKGYHGSWSDWGNREDTPIEIS